MAHDSDQQERSRRTLLKHLAAGGAAAGAARALPDKWVKPIVDAVVVPLHAQTSPSLINPILLAGNWSGSVDTSTMLWMFRSSVGARHA